MSTYAEYDALPGIRSSRLKLAATSPLHYHEAVEKASTALAAGSALHCAVFEPDELPLRYIVYEKTRRGKEWDKFDAAMGEQGIETLYPAEWDRACAMRDAVQRHPLARLLLTGGDAETDLQWTDTETGLPCKARLDYRVPQAVPAVIVDLKSARRIDDYGFSRATLDYGYHISAAHYLAGARAVFGHGHDFQFVAVESGPVHDVRVGPISEDALWCGENERKRLMALIQTCTERDEWPGAFPAEDTFDLPSWFYAQGERADTMALEGLTPKGDK